MSALGDYIHLRAANYTAHGTTMKGTYDAIGSYENYKKKRAAAIKEVKPATIATLKQRLKKDSGIQEKKDKVNNDQDFQEKINMIYEFLAERATDGVIGWYEGNAKTGGGWSYTGDYQYLKGKTISKEEIMKKRALVDEINKLLDKIQIDGQTGSAAQSDIDQVVNLYKQLGGTKSSLGEIQDDINNFSYYTWISNLAGAFGELFVSACQDTAEGVAVNSVEDFLSGVVGGQGSSITLDKSALAKDVSSYITTDATGTKYSFGKSQDKVDVDIIVNRENVLATVKNYKDTSEVTLQGQTSLLAALVKMNNEGNYANHWLNCHAGRILKNNTAVEADKTLQFEIAYDALVGGNPLKEGAKQANVFVVMNRMTGDVMIKSTKDVLFKELDNIKISPSIVNIRLKNTINKTYQDRITHILMQIHQRNLHVSYKSGQ